MCVICCSYDPEPVVLNAAYRLLAVRANVKQAQDLLETLGFKGLKLSYDAHEVIKFKFTAYDQKAVEKMLGVPKSRQGGKGATWDFGGKGAVSVWPDKHLVILRNKTDGTAVEPPMPKGPAKPIHAPPPPAQPPALPVVKPEPRTGTENDDAHVPVTHISKHLHDAYMVARVNPEYRLQFMKELWKELNTTKFAGKMRLPYVSLMKNMGASRMRIRGYWRLSTRELKIAPSLFNATQNFFVETFLHEMCHQATYEAYVMSNEERADNKKTKGHGRVWAMWMKKVGLNPLRFDPNENTVYMTDEEREAQEAREDRWQQSKDEAESQGLQLARNLAYGMPVIVRREATANFRQAGLVKGYAVTQVTKKNNQWAIITDEQAKRGAYPNERFSWMLNHGDTIYADSTRPDLKEDHKFLSIAGQVLKHYIAKKQLRERKKEINRHGWY